MLQQKHVEIGGDEKSTSLALSSVDLVLVLYSISPSCRQVYVLFHNGKFEQATSVRNLRFRKFQGS